MRKMADVYTEGYRIGFINTGKDLSKKSVVNIRYTLGFERVIRIAIDNFRKMGLKPVIYRAASGVITKREHHKIGYFGGIANWQYEYDPGRIRRSSWTNAILSAGWRSCALSRTA